MNITLDYLRGKRSWLVTNFVVWGDYYSSQFLCFYTEVGESSKRIIFDQVSLGGFDQSVNFADLYDYKGNNLPSAISNPKVMVLFKNEVYCFVVGQETDFGFKIAKLSGTQASGLVDLLILEMGE
ncbi:MAG: hypothetical protein MUO85_01170 [candidate division Zixibacteria bacterium]|nr:hypothetical protein [candidate division Zixibacteria bacterium]